jgi:hypothetical protein
MMKNFIRLFVVAGALAAAAVAVAAAELTAFDLIKEGNKHVGEDAKDKVAQLRSEKSVGSLTPTVWYVVFFDPDATAKATEVKFAAGKKVAVKRPARVLEFGSGSYRPVDRSKLKIDSNKAIEVAIKDPLLANLQLTNTQLTLERAGRDDDAPVWKVRLWAAKVRKPTDTVEVGDMRISAQDGKVLKSNLKIQRAD